MVFDINTPKEIQSLMNLIDTYRRWTHYQEKGDREYNFYHPSELGKCLRKQQYYHYGYLGLLNLKQKEFDSRILRLFDKGHNMHKRWISYFEDCGILRGRWECKNSYCCFFDEKGEYINKKISYEDRKSRIYGEENSQGIFKPDKCLCGCKEFEYLETPVFSEKLNIKGRADAIIDCSNLLIDRFKEVRSTYNLELLPRNGEIAVGDMKTIGSRAWDYQLLNRGPHKEYLIQLNCYAFILDCSYGILMYENKDNSEIRWYRVEKNEKWWEIIKWQVTTMKEMVEERKLPPPKPEKKDCYECKSCDCKAICHKSKIWNDNSLKEKRVGFYKDLL